jgi:hypothetical protein
MDSSLPPDLNLYVKRWNGTTWTPLGNAVDTNIKDYADAPSLAINSLGTPFVAFAEDVQNPPIIAINYNIYVKSYQ